MSDTPAQRWRRMSTIGLPLLLVAVAVLFIRERPQTPTGPPPEAIASVAADPCTLFTATEMSLLVEARIVERQRDVQPPRQVCSYHGDAQSAGTIIEVTFVPPDELRRLRGRRFRPSDLLAEVAAEQQGEAVADLGDEAVYVPTGSGQLWVRDGDLVLSVAVVRNVTEGDEATARSLAGVILAKLNAPTETAT